MHGHFMHDERGRFRVVRIVGVTLGGLTLAVLLAIGLGWLVQYLWNNTLVVLFKLPLITYWQAVGLFLLGKLLFGGVGHGFHGHHGPRHQGRHWHRCGRGGEATAGLGHEHFQDFWEAEGKAAFEEYLKKMKI
jgi:hypothetical protein